MSDELPDTDPELDPATEARIRALLADLGSASTSGSESLPPAVATRLDETLAGLVAERGATDHAPAEASVVPLRRRWTTRAAAAAAAVIVVGAGGVAAANLGLLGGGSGSSSSTSSGAADSRAESQDHSATTPPSVSGSTGAVPSLSPASFGHDVAALVASGAVPAPGPRPGARSQQAPLPSNGTVSTAPLRGTGCSGPPTADGSTPLLVRYDGAPAVLVVHPERGGTRLVEAWTCAGDRRLDSATVPVTHGSSGRSTPPGGELGGSSPSP